MATSPTATARSADLQVLRNRQRRTIQLQKVAFQTRPFMNYKISGNLSAATQCSKTSMFMQLLICHWLQLFALVAQSWSKKDGLIWNQLQPLAIDDHVPHLWLWLLLLRASICFMHFNLVSKPQSLIRKWPLLPDGGRNEKQSGSFLQQPILATAWLLM